MSPWINYHHLYYFWVIAEEGSVSKAAARLRLGQPTLSSQLRSFEDTLGVKLFERHHKRLLLTEHGQVAREYARTIFRTGAEMLEALQDRLKPSRPSLVIGSLDAVPKQLVTRLAKAAMALGPCQLALREGAPGEMIRELSAHRVDLYLTNFLPAGPDARGLFHRLLARSPVSVYGTPAYKALRKNFPVSLGSQPMILPTYDSKLRYDLDQWGTAHGISFEVLVEGQEVGVKKLLASEGVGLLAASRLAVGQQLLAGELLEIGALEGVREEFYLVSAARKIANPLAARLMREFQLRA